MKIYDITDKENAYDTLLRLTDARDIVIQHCLRLATYDGSGNVFQQMIEDFNVHPTFKCDDLICHLQHMTTSANGCKHIKEKGLTDLRVTYEDTDSELRQFLDEQNIKIDLSGQRLYFNGEDMGSIKYSKGDTSRDFLSEEYKRISVGRKFYYDFCICGFFSFDHESPYGGNVNRRPEILHNISELIKKNIDQIWAESHKTYVVKFSVPYNQLVLENPNFNEIDFLQWAFYNAVGNPDENIVLLKDHVSVPSEDIISIERFDYKRRF